MKKIALLAATAAVFAGAGAFGLSHAPAARAADPAPSAVPPPLTQCVDTRSLRTKMIVSKNQLVVEDDFHHAALLTLSQPCDQMDDLDHIGFIIEGDSRLCQIHDVKIEYAHQDDHLHPMLRCLITDLKPLTLDQVKAYSYPAKSH
jgi:hypothetical protein